MYCLFLFFSLVVVQDDFGAVGRYLVVVEFHQFFFGEEDDRFLKYLEFCLVYVYIGVGAVTFADCPFEEPFETAEVFLSGFFFEVLSGSEESNEFVEALFVEVLVFDLGVVGCKVVAECLPALEGCISPLACGALFLYELGEIFKDVSCLWLFWSFLRFF